MSGAVGVAWAVVRNWLHQGWRFQCPAERTLKAALTVVPMLVLGTILWPALGGWGIAVAFVSAHTANWLLNGQFWVLARRWGRRVDPSRLQAHLDGVVARASRRAEIAAVAIYGSYVRRGLSPTSDLDVVAVPREGAAWGACRWAAEERRRAFVAGIPLDLYVRTSWRQLDGYREDEAPNVRLDRDGRFAAWHRWLTEWRAAGRPRPVLGMASAGGHLAELRLALSKVARSCVVYVTYPETHLAIGERHHFVPNVTTPANLLVNAWRSLAILLVERPRAVVSTGAGVAVPLCLLARAMGVPLVWIESGAQVTRPSRTGRLLSAWAMRSYVQWPGVRLPRARHAGPLLGLVAGEPAPARREVREVVALVGTTPFDRLIAAVQRACERGGWKLRAQVSRGREVPGSVRFLPRDELLRWIDEADAVVCHAGYGTVMDVLARGKVPVLLVRGRLQVELAERLDAAGLARWARSEEDLDRLIPAKGGARGAVPACAIPDEVARL